MGAFTSRRSTLIVLLAGLALAGACGDAPPAAGPIVLVDDLGATAANLRSLSESLRERPSSLLGLRAPRDRQPGDAAATNGGRP